MTIFASPVPGPSVTDWMQGWGTVLGALFSGIAALGAVILIWHELSVRREERLEREVAQARTVIVGMARAQTSLRTGIHNVECYVENCGTAPIINRNRSGENASTPTESEMRVIICCSN